MTMAMVFLGIMLLVSAMKEKGILILVKKTRVERPRRSLFVNIFLAEGGQIVRKLCYL